MLTAIFSQLVIFSFLPVGACGEWRGIKICSCLRALDPPRYYFHVSAAKRQGCDCLVSSNVAHRKIEKNAGIHNDPYMENTIAVTPPALFRRSATGYMCTTLGLAAEPRKRCQAEEHSIATWIGRPVSIWPAISTQRFALNLSSARGGGRVRIEWCFHRYAAHPRGPNVRSLGSVWQ